MGQILVLGANGTVGAPLVSELRARGHEVLRATSRKVIDADQVHLNLVTGEGIERALDSVRRVFLLSPPGHVNQDELLGPVIEAAKKKQVEKVVLMTAMGANADPAGAMRKAELHLIESGVPWNVIRPNWFMQNFNTYWLHGISALGKILLPAGKAKGSFIDTRDISASAAALLDSDAHANRELDLTGPRALDHDEVAAILSQETGRSIAYQEVTPEEMLSGLLGAGLPRPYAEFMLVILGYFKAGYAERTTGAVRELIGRDPIAFERYASDYRQSWL